VTRSRAWLVGAVGVLCAGGCGGSPAATRPLSSGGPPPPATATAAGQQPRHLVDASLGGVRLRLEVADDAHERAVGLMGRTSVPPGTGMLFRFPGPVRERFYMFQVPVPLTAVFVRDGAVLSVVQMPPCPLADPYACPTYGPDAPYDTVVETAPETLPAVHTGDRLTLQSG
jgi:uncharacterized membrane protein (UPF0127 family)